MAYLLIRVVRLFIPWLTPPPFCGAAILVIGFSSLAALQRLRESIRCLSALIRELTGDRKLSRKTLQIAMEVGRKI